MSFKTFLGIRENVLNGREIEIITDALEKASKEETFNSLYFDSSNTVFSTSAFKNKKEAENARIAFLVQKFMESGTLGYVISHSHEWYNRFTKLDTENKLELSKNSNYTKEQILEALGGLSTIQIGLKENPPNYKIDHNGRLCYPGLICNKTPKETSIWFIKLIKPLLSLK